MPNIPYKNVMAGQLNGPVIQSLLQAKHEIFDEKGYELINHRNSFSVDTATTAELELLGLLCNVPRPYAVLDGQTVLANDADYRLFFKNVMALRQSQSLIGLADVFYQFLPNGEFNLEIDKTTGDIRVVLDITFEPYLPFLEQAAKSVYTASPQLQPFELRDFFYFIWDNMLYLRYIQLAQPNVWTFTYNPEKHSLEIISNEEGTTTIGFDMGQLDDNGDGTYTPKATCYDNDLIAYPVVSDNALNVEVMYKTYNDENNVQHTNGRALFAKHPGVLDAQSGVAYSALYEPKEPDKPLAPEQPNMALLLGVDKNEPKLLISNKAVAPSDYFDDTLVPYGEGSADRVQRSKVSFVDHKVELALYNVRRTLTLSVTQT